MIIDKNFKIKFRLLCENEQEWIDIQYHLFDIGYYWAQGKVLQNSYWKFPAIIKNYRTPDEFGGRNLIQADYNLFKSIYPNKNIDKVSIYLRKVKMKKINSL